MELFAWLQSHHARPDLLTLVAGPGHVTMKAVPGSYAAVKELVADPSKGALLSATAIARLHCQGEVRYVMLQRDLDAPVSPGCWQIPAGRCSPLENPNETAPRELAEEVGIDGVGAQWSDGAVSVGNTPVRYTTPEGELSLQGQWAFHHNTYEFYVFVDLEVPSFEAVRLWDLEPYGRTVGLFTTEELLTLHREGKLADGTAAVVEAMLERGQLPA